MASEKTVIPNHWAAEDAWNAPFETALSLPDFMDKRKQLKRDIAFVNGLLAKDGYHPFMREFLVEAKQQMEYELRELDFPLDFIA